MRKGKVDPVVGSEISHRFASIAGNIWALQDEIRKIFKRHVESNGHKVVTNRYDWDSAVPIECHFESQDRKTKAVLGYDIRHGGSRHHSLLYLKPGGVALVNMAMVSRDVRDLIRSRRNE